MKKTHALNTHLQRQGDTVSYFMLAPAATELALSASSVMSLHRCCKYIITALSLHVWTASKNSFSGTSLHRKTLPGSLLTCSGHRTHALTGETSSRLARKTLALFISKDTKSPWQFRKMHKKLAGEGGRGERRESASERARERDGEVRRGGRGEGREGGGGGGGMNRGGGGGRGGTPWYIYLIHIKRAAPRSLFSLDAGVLCRFVTNG